MVSKTDLTSYADDNTTFVTANNIDDVITVIKNVRKTKIENSNRKNLVRIKMNLQLLLIIYSSYNQQKPCLKSYHNMNMVKTLSY